MKAIFLRVLESDDKPAALLDAARSPKLAGDWQRFEVVLERFGAISRSPFAYWASAGVLECFRRFPAIETEGRHAAAGAQTRDNMRFVRAGWEVQATEIGGPGNALHSPCDWVWLAKGGSHGRFYADVHLLVQWANDGRELKAATAAWRAGKGWGDYWRAAINSSEYYGRPGITWPVRSQKGFSARALGGGAIFGHKGPTVFLAEDDIQTLQSTLAVMNSGIFSYLVSLQMAFGAYEVGVIQNTPVPILSRPDEESLSSLARRAWLLTCTLDRRKETSRTFTIPALLQVKGGDPISRTATYMENVLAMEAKLAAIQAEIDERCFDLYGIDTADRDAIIRGLDVEIPNADSGDESSDEDTSEEGEDDQSAFDTASLAADLLSWSVGVAFGRFDIRLASGEREPPPEPEPFAPLPACSPGMLTGEDGVLFDAPPPGYPIAFPRDGILADDPGDPADVTGRVRAVFDCVFGAEAERFWTEAARILRDGDGDLRPWLSRGLFEDTIRRYSKSRRKAPIYWQLATPSASYSVWLYYHRLTKDTFYTVRSDHVGPKLQHEEQRLSSLLSEAGANPNSGQRRRIAEQEALVEELRALREEVVRIAPLWNPHHDDGVIINFAPLWRLVPQHRGWQRECKACWDRLVAGEYDWSHLAMHLWPERVVPKCAVDRSLAIAHGLEEIFWFEGNDGKWKRRDVPARPIEELVRERTSPAVKAALKSLLEAPAPDGGGNGRGRRAPRRQRRTAGSLR